MQLNHVKLVSSHNLGGCHSIGRCCGRREAAWQASSCWRASSRRRGGELQRDRLRALGRIWLAHMWVPRREDFLTHPGRYGSKGRDQSPREFSLPFRVMADGALA